jgi:ethanolamine ammonia-lyase small subunit
MTKTIHRDLPQVLILKRTYIQRFPNGQQVALYHSEHLNQYITVPLDGSKFSNTSESVLEKLTQISENDDIQPIIFNDLSELNINKECADVILNFISNNEELAEQLHVSDKSFLEILEQAAQLESTDLSEESGQQQELTNDEIVK